eukprot:m.111137 g.111137  ORF g.111137 m.111137 type:complete len:78 (-) comp13431_c2_seq1:405-638(-)
MSARAQVALLLQKGLTYICFVILNPYSPTHPNSFIRHNHLHASNSYTRFENQPTGFSRRVGGNSSSEFQLQREAISR